MTSRLLWLLIPPLALWLLLRRCRECGRCEQDVSVIIASLQAENEDWFRDLQLANETNKLLAAELKTLRNRPYVPQMVTADEVEATTKTDAPMHDNRHAPIWSMELAEVQAELAKVQDELIHRREAHDATISVIVALERELAEARERGDRLVDLLREAGKLGRGARAESVLLRRTIAQIVSEHGCPVCDTETPKHDEACYLDNAMRRLTPQAAALLTEIESTETYLATAQKQLDKIDEALPNWHWTGRGRMETIAALQRRLEALEKLKEAVDKLDGVRRWEFTGSGDEDAAAVWDIILEARNAYDAYGEEEGA